MASMNNPVGLVGVGKMGGALLARLTAAGARVRAFDIKDTAMQAARAGGAETVDSSAEAARGATIVHVFVHDDQEIFDATLGADGVLAGAAKGATVILHSTILPATTLRVAEAAARQGVRVIDACVTSVPRLVRDGQATFLVGGSDDVVAEMRPHLQSLGRAVWHFGPVGSGNAAKLVKNLTNAMERVMWVEALTLVETAGIDVRRFVAMVQSVDKGSAIASWEKTVRIEDGHVLPQPAGGLYSKDVQHAAKFARDLGLTLALTQGAADVTARWAAREAEEPQQAAE
jgi:3-hydroxyisobutyrate dehydrogenase-like beta-hydroxyacid dehydrogenase